MNNVATEMVVLPDIAGPMDAVPHDGRVLAISEMSDLFDVTLRTLRFYEEKGLLNPVRRGARRFYGTKDVARMRVILQAKKIGFTLAEIRQVIALVEGDKPREQQYADLRQMCANQQQLLMEQKAMLDDQVAEVEGILSAFDKVMSN
ncbi:MerR family transcriptional regulator [Roseibium aquae]|uniref:MerR family transcriptional regulator n=1 Tax=Roseibium aquae TaxID=1323746 RepID=A0A916WWK9_9HYPH|nr:MerR family DNA-binding transcriptional regulator [Roseibium aquae]GGB35536.1 MerR family transcriptional regulator [Roseibium aquae]